MYVRLRRGRAVFVVVGTLGQVPLIVVDAGFSDLESLFASRHIPDASEEHGSPIDQTDDHSDGDSREDEDAHQDIAGRSRRL